MASPLFQKDEDWRSFLGAAPRKVAIARYHLERLRSLLTPCPEADSAGLPPMEVQAYFEGVLFSVIAAASQVEEAIRYAKGFDRYAPQHKILQSIPVPPMRDWYASPLSRDLQELRNAGFHRSYEKTRNDARWLVNKPPIAQTESSYEGSRELQEYTGAALRHAEKFLDLIPKIRAELEK
jgi:hypothetical protein